MNNSLIINHVLSPLGKVLVNNYLHVIKDNTSPPLEECEDALYKIKLMSGNAYKLTIHELLNPLKDINDIVADIVDDFREESDSRIDDFHLCLTICDHSDEHYAWDQRTSPDQIFNRIRCKTTHLEVA